MKNFLRILANGFISIINGLIVAGFPLILLIMSSPSEPEPGVPQVEPLDTAAFWSSWIPWLLLVLLAISFLLFRKIKKEMINRQLPQGLVLLSSFAVMQFRAALLHFWILSLTGNGQMDSNDFIAALAGWGIWAGLLMLLSWLWYGKVMRSRIENEFIDDLKAYAKNNGGSISYLEKIKSLIYDSEAIRHQAPSQTLEYSSRESMPVMISFDNPLRVFAIHWLHTSMQDHNSKGFIEQKGWTLCAAGEVDPNLLSMAGKGVFRPKELESSIADPVRKKEFRRLIKERVLSVELTDSHYLVTAEPRYDVVIFSVKPPHADEVMKFIETAQSALGKM